MHYLIDGHNLIGKCRTISLGAPDDEAQLIDLLHRWLLRNNRHQSTVVFDGGVYGHPEQLRAAGIRVIFAHSPQDADARLKQLIECITDRQQYRVVTSDRAVAAMAHAHGIEIVTAEQFAAQLEQPVPKEKRPQRRRRPEPKLSRNEVENWLREFGADEQAE